MMRVTLLSCLLVVVLVVQEIAACSPIGFHSQRLSVTNTLYKTKQNIIFDQVKTNVGSGFNAMTGYFTAPVDGLYMFHYMIMTHPNSPRPKNNQVMLYQENTMISVSITSYTNGIYYPCSGMAVLSLTKGQRIAVKNHFADVKYMSGEFSGALLAEA